MIRLEFIIGTLIFFSGLLSTYPQEFEFFRINNEKGLPQSTIYSIKQSNDGFIWIATQEGLNKYDGYSFKVYNYNPRDSFSISNNNISIVYEDRKNNLWLGTWGGGLNRFDKKSEKFISYLNKPGDPNSISHNRVPIIYEDKEGTLWLGTAGGGLNSFDIKTGKFITYKYEKNNEKTLSNNRIWGITEDNSGNLWIGTDYGFNCFNVHSKINKRFYINLSDPKRFKSNIIRAIHFNKKGELWLGTEEGLYTFNVKTSGINKIDLSKELNILSDGSTINCFYESDDKLLIGTVGYGLLIFDYIKNKFSQYTYNNESPRGISGNDIRCISKDKTGLYWLGTRNDGINTTLLKPCRFKVYNDESWQKLKLSGKGVRAALIDKKGNLWLGTNFDGLNKINTSRDKVSFYKKGNDENSLLDNRISSLKEDDNGNIWVATNVGLNRLNPSTGNVRRIVFKGNSLNEKSINDLRCLEIKNNIIWVGTYGGGLIKYNSTDGSWLNFISDPSSKNSLVSNEILALMTDSENILWIGTTDGLNSFDLKTGKIEQVGAELKDGYTLRRLQIYSLLEAHDGIIWIGSSLGLYSFNKKNHEYKHFTTEDGLPNNVIYTILEDEGGHLWVSTNKGICHFNPLNRAVNIYDKLDGLQDNFHYIGAAFKSAQGEFLFGGINGVTSFYPDKMEIYSPKPRVVISKLEALQEEEAIDLLKYKAEGDDNLPEYHIYPGQKILNIEFFLLDFYIPEKNNYRYMLEGFDGNWIESGNKRSIRYTNLSEGTYIFKVLGSNSENVWSSEVTMIRLVVHPPFYRTSLFRIAMFILVVLLAISIYSYRTRHMRKLQKILEEKVKLRTQQLLDNEEKLKQANESKDKFFSIIAHDLRNPFMALISITKLLRENYNDFSEDDKKRSLRQIEESSKDTYVLLENLLEWAKTQTNRIEINKLDFDLNEAIDENLKIAQKSGEMKDIVITFEKNESVLVYADRNLFNTTLRNLLSNAVKFTVKHGQIAISTEKKEDEAVVIIHDTGVGIPKENLDKLFHIEFKQSTMGTNKEHGSGLGLIICKEFIEKNGGRIWVESEINRGSKFFFTIPLSKKTN